MNLTERIFSGEKVSLRNTRIFLTSPDTINSYARMKIKEIRGQFKHFFLEKKEPGVFSLIGTDRSGKEAEFVLLIDKNLSMAKVSKIMEEHDRSNRSK